MMYSKECWLVHIENQAVSNSLTAFFLFMRKQCENKRFEFYLFED